MHAAIGDRRRFDEEVRHVDLGDGDLLLDALALEPNLPWRETDAIGRTREQDKDAIVLVDIDGELDLVQGLMFLLRRSIQRQRSPSPRAAAYLLSR